MRQIAIIGAGVLGASVAWRLAEAGHDVYLVERNSTIGGAVSGRSYSGR